MASQTLNTLPTFPEGTSVGAYPITNWPTGIVNESAAPPGSATNSQTVSGGSVTFTGLTDATRYVAYALVNSQHRYMGFKVGTTLSTVTDHPSLSLIDAKGDLLVGTADNAVTRKAVGTDGQRLTADAASTGGVKWADVTAETLPATIIDAKGDLIVGSAADTAVRKAVGNNDEVLVADSAAAGGVKWAPNGASGVEIDSKVLTTNPGDSSHTNATTSFVAVTGLGGLVVPIGSRPVKLRYSANVRNDTATKGTWLAIYDESNVLVPGSAYVFYSATANAQGVLSGEVRFAAPVAQHTYHIRLAAAGSNTATILLNSSQYAWFEAVTR